MKKLKKTYPTALREEAVKLVLTQGLSIEQAAAGVSIPKGRSPIGWPQPAVVHQK